MTILLISILNYFMHVFQKKKKYPTVDLNHGLLQVSEYPVQIKEDYMQFTDIVGI